MTEDKARTHDCPFMTYIWNEADVIQEGRAPIYYQSKCQASDCIAWRWASRWPASEGYCGAAGKP